MRTLRSFLWFFIAMVVTWVLTAVDFFVIDTGMVTSAVGYSSGKGRNVGGDSKAGGREHVH